MPASYEYPMSGSTLQIADHHDYKQGQTIYDGEKEGREQSVDSISLAFPKQGQC